MFARTHTGAVRWKTPRMRHLFNAALGAILQDSLFKGLKLKKYIKKEKNIWYGPAY